MLMCDVMGLLVGNQLPILFSAGIGHTTTDAYSASRCTSGIELREGRICGLRDWGRGHLEDKHLRENACLCLDRLSIIYEE